MSLWDDLKHWFKDPCEVHDEPDVREVTVHKGDWLEKIVGHDPERVKQVVAMNPDKNWDEKLTIYPDEKLRIPADWLSH